jgi:hypothetical protein
MFWATFWVIFFMQCCERGAGYKNDFFGGFPSISSFQFFIDHCDQCCQMVNVF